MDDEQRRRRSAPPQAPPAPGQVPDVIYGVNAISGELEARPTKGQGVQWFSDGNSRPAPALPVNTGAQNYGTAGEPVLAALVPVRESGAGVQFTGPNASDPEPDHQLQVLTGRKRKARELLAAEFVRSG
jgi:hypothetical protein